jgi:hypothetical protein
MPIIELTQGKIALVDDKDYQRVIDYGLWQYHRQHGYAFKSKPTLYLHQFILKTNLQVDHRNHDKLDCRRHNLRVATQTQNIRSRAKWSNTTSKFKGVYWDKQLLKWRVQISPDRKRIHLGCFESEIEAAETYNVAALQYFGEFAELNKI